MEFVSDPRLGHTAVSFVRRRVDRLETVDNLIVDRIRNPFAPGAGARPPELAGREEILETASVLLQRVLAGRAEKSLLLTGLRGVGKTVLLNEIERGASTANYHTISVEAEEGRSLGQLLAPHLKRVLLDLDRMAEAREKVKRGLRVLRSFLGTLKLTVSDITVGLDVAPETGSADSGDLAVDLPTVVAAVGEAAQERQTAVAILIDEIHVINRDELGALIGTMHRMQQRQLPIVVVGAGLPILPALVGGVKSYTERLFAFPNVGALSLSDASRAVVQPALDAGVIFEPDAIREIYRMTRGYPYFLQEWAYHAWNISTGSPITLGVIADATSVSIASLDESFFRVRYERLTNGEKHFLRAMAELGAGPQRSSDVAQVLGTRVVGPHRSRLIRKGMIYSPSHGDLAFTVPLFDEFLIRAIPYFP